MTLPRIHTAHLRTTHLSDTKRTLTLAFAPVRPVQHRAGQHGIWRIPGVGTLPFTFASAPGADLLELSTAFREDSARKVALRGLAAGTRVRVAGAFGGFPTEVATTRSLVMVAQGIGITPFVSMLRELRDVSAARPHVQLVQVGVPHHVHEAMSLADESWIHRHRDGFEGRLDALSADRPGEHRWLVSGTADFARSVSRRLRSRGVPAEMVHTDAFWGMRAPAPVHQVAS